MFALHHPCSGTLFLRNENRLRRPVMPEVDPDAYLAFAVDCLRKSRSESADRWMYVVIARAWINLADRAEVELDPNGRAKGPEAVADAPAFH
jgi:hypothetical protein